jgi:hypothetical protein
MAKRKKGYDSQDGIIARFKRESSQGLRETQSLPQKIVR